MSKKGSLCQILGTRRGAAEQERAEEAAGSRDTFFVVFQFISRNQATSSVVPQCRRAGFLAMALRGQSRPHSLMQEQHRHKQAKTTLFVMISMTTFIAATTLLTKAWHRCFLYQY